MSINSSRKIIRAAAESVGCKYRIRRSGEVNFYGTMPNSNKIGWYFVAWDAEELALEIQSETQTKTGNF